MSYEQEIQKLFNFWSVKVKHQFQLLNDNKTKLWAKIRVVRCDWGMVGFDWILIGFDCKSFKFSGRFLDFQMIKLQILLKKTSQLNSEQTKSSSHTSIKCFNGQLPYIPKNQQHKNVIFS